MIQVFIKAFANEEGKPWSHSLPRLSKLHPMSAEGLTCG